MSIIDSASINTSFITNYSPNKEANSSSFTTTVNGDLMSLESDSNKIDDLIYVEKVILLGWCRSHDWGKDAEIRDGLIYGIEEIIVSNDGKYSYVIDVVFDTVDELIIWAGY